MFPAPEFRAMKGYREAGGRLHAFITTAVHGSGSTSRCGRLMTEEISPVTCTAIYVEPRAFLEAVVKRKSHIPAINRIATVQRATIECTD
jgi:hypothetical protein